MKVIKNVAVLIVIIGGIFMTMTRRKLIRRELIRRELIRRELIRRTSSFIHLLDGSAVRVFRRGMVSARDARQDAILGKAVSKATSEKVKKGLPVAKYDLKRKQAYWEFPDGRTEYV